MKGRGLGHVSERGLMAVGRREGGLLWRPGGDTVRQLRALRRAWPYVALGHVEFGCFAFGFVCGAERAEAKAREGRT